MEPTVTISLEDYEELKVRASQRPYLTGKINTPYKSYRFYECDNDAINEYIRLINLSQDEIESLKDLIVKMKQKRSFFKRLFGC